MGSATSLSAGDRLGKYEILAPLGSGGMGEVYRARDTKLGREVAVKVLPASLSRSPEALARFDREAQAVAALSHPGILAIHDLGQHGDAPYAVMELLEGETLRLKLVTGPLPPRKVVDYALQIAEGLAAAHAKGIVHRDLKPDNLFVTTDGRVKILDFGLAKQTGEDSAAARQPAKDDTVPGTVLGTAGYMSPEQVRGLPADPRSDIFSFGAVLLEMLSGRQAFRRETAADTMAAILKEEPPDLADVSRSPAPALDRIARRCLRKDPDERFQSARDIAFGLASLKEVSSSVMSEAPAALPVPRQRPRRLVLAMWTGAVLVVLAGILLALRNPGPEGVRRIAVLPFENVGATEDEYFVDGIADEVRGKLTSLPGLEVIAGSTSRSYRKSGKSPREIARELGVSYLLTATVRWEKGPDGVGRVHVSPELVEVKRSGAPSLRWQQPFDADLTGVFQVQADIAARVAEALGVALQVGDANRLRSKTTRNVAAYEEFLRGEAAAKGLAVSDPASVRRAMPHYLKAVTLDAGFAEAWARLSEARAILYSRSIPTEDLAGLSREAAELSLRLAPERPESHLAEGTYQRLVVRDPGKALRHFAEAHARAPRSVDALVALATAEMELGRWRSALDHLRQAKPLDPRSVHVARRQGDVLLRLRRPREAREALDQGLGSGPGEAESIAFRAMTFLQEGDLAGARVALVPASTESDPAVLAAQVALDLGLGWVLTATQIDELVRLGPSAFDEDLGSFALVLAEREVLRGDPTAARGHAEEAARVFAEQVQAAPRAAARQALLGLALAYAGRKVEALRAGEAAVALVPVEQNARDGPHYRHLLARLLIHLGEPEKALDQLGPLLSLPYFLTPRWLEVDPTFGPLRGNPRFQRLVARSAEP